MGQVTNSVHIRRPRPAVFDLVTTGRYWPRWHPATIAVAGDVDHPVQPGEHIVETARILGRTSSAEWTCVEYDRPSRLTLAAAGAGGAALRIAYTFADEGAGTRFTRALTYHFPALAAAPAQAALDQTMQEQSAQAVANLAALVEATVPAASG